MPNEDGPAGLSTSAIPTGLSALGTGTVCDERELAAEEIDVAYEFIADAIDPNVHDHRTRPDHLPFDEFRDADRRHAVPVPARAGTG